MVGLERVDLFRAGHVCAQHDRNPRLVLLATRKSAVGERLDRLPTKEQPRLIHVRDARRAVLLQHLLGFCACLPVSIRLRYPPCHVVGAA